MPCGHHSSLIGAAGSWGLTWQGRQLMCLPMRLGTGQQTRSTGVVIQDGRTAVLRPGELAR